MSLIVNGVTIPTNGDFVATNGTKLDKVVCNGITVWEKSAEKYIFKEGVSSEFSLIQISTSEDYSFGYDSGAKATGYKNYDWGSDDGWCWVSCRTNPAIELTGYKKIVIVYNCTIDNGNSGGSCTPRVHLINYTKTDSFGSGDDANNKILTFESGGLKTVEAQIGGAKCPFTKCFVGLSIDGHNSHITGNFGIKEIRLVP